MEYYYIILLFYNMKNKLEFLLKELIKNKNDKSLKTENKNKFRILIKMK